MAVPSEPASVATRRPPRRRPGQRSATTRRRSPGRDYRLPDGVPAIGWTPARRSRRLAAWLADGVLLVATLGVGWAVWAWRTAARGATPGKALLGIAVFATDTARAADRPRMLRRALVYQGLAVLLGVATLGLGWVYCVGAMLGSSRRAVYDEWAGVVLLERPSS